MKIFAGVDEAGRGPVLGPLVMAIVACTPEDKKFFNKIGVKDSKLLTEPKRRKLARIIKARCEHVIIKSSPQQIDKALINPSSSLNILEAEVSGKLIKRLLKKSKVDEVMLDLPAKNKEEYLNHVRKKAETKIPIKAEFKADLNYIEVSAASILAKTTRDASIKTVEKKLGFQIGSGYPADPNTVRSLGKHFEQLKEENLVRKQWKTAKNIEDKKAQTSLSNF